MRYVSYIRVSTKGQESSGLGLEAQQASIQRHLESQGGDLVGEYREAESGKRCDRPQLQAAMERCRTEGATLLIAKLDRLARNVHFISGLMESGVAFVACDMPSANRLTLHILAAVAEEEARAISERTKRALEARRARGLPMGGQNCTGPRTEAQLRHLGAIGSRGCQTNREKAEAFRQTMRQMIQERLARGESLGQVARDFNAQGLPTARGTTWRAEQVRRVMAEN